MNSTKEINIICPVSESRVDENISRIAAFITIGVTAVSLVFNLAWPMCLLAIDFALRAFTSGHWSVTKWLSKGAVFILNLDARPVDAAPKKFAALLGTVLTLSIAFLTLYQWTLYAFVASTILIACAFIEGAFAFCLGCAVFTSVVKPILLLRKIT